MGYSFVRAAVACAILERISGLEPSSETTAPMYLKLVTPLNVCPFAFISLWMPLALLRIYILRAKRTRWKGVFAKLSMMLQQPCKVMRKNKQVLHQTIFLLLYLIFEYLSMYRLCQLYRYPYNVSSSLQQAIFVFY